MLGRTKEFSLFVRRTKSRSVGFINRRKWTYDVATTEISTAAMNEVKAAG